MVRVYTFFLILMCIESIYAVDEGTCLNVFDKNYSNLLRSTNPVQAFIYSSQTAFENKGSECIDILSNSIHLFGRAVVAEEAIREVITQGQTINPSQLSEYYESYLNKEPPADLVSLNNSKIMENKESCGDVDYRNQMPSIRNQTDVGWCYANAAADLVSFKEGEAVSAVDIALQNNHYKNKKKLTKGLSQVLGRDEEGTLRFDFQSIMDTAQSLDDATLKSNCSNGESICFNEGGHGAFAILVGKQKGFCKESALPSKSKNAILYGEILFKLNELDEMIGQSENLDQAMHTASELCSGDMGQYVVD
ncbi:MAG: hypothetical protein NXH75_13900, partial [Halobacteriovoraceae bacterium]|nr:hypothetical protein [Halobacteriovoraceae bacterium]